MECKLCGNKIQGFGNNGQPLVEGRVCDECNWKVIQERLKQAKLAKDIETKSASESVSLGEIDGVVVGGGGPVNVTNPMEDFEKYAKQFEETFILGKTPVRKEIPKNNTKIKDGVVEGDISSLDRDESLEQVEPVKSATEALHGFSQIYEFFKLCEELGIKDFEWVDRFIKDHPGDPLTELRNYSEKTLGENWKNKDLTLEDQDEIRHLRARQILAEDREKEV